MSFESKEKQFMFDMIRKEKPEERCKKCKTLCNSLGKRNFIQYHCERVQRGETGSFKGIQKSFFKGRAVKIWACDWMNSR